MGLELIKETQDVAIKQLDETVYMAIIGGGPKGMYGLERLIAELNSEATCAPVEIHIYNRTRHFGSGDVYRTDQPLFLKMNVPNSAIDIWLREEPECPVKDTSTFTEWINQNPDVTDNLAPDDYSSRAIVGQYLEDGLKKILSQLPPRVIVKLIQGSVSDLKKVDKHYLIKTESNNSGNWHPHHYSHILLATGHPSKSLTHEEQEWVHFSKTEPRTGYIPFIYPVQQALQNIDPGSTVGLKGMGLTFVDAVLALTEGRGGQFITQGEKLTYISSGQEPSKIYPFSRTGIPMIARGPKIDANHTLKFFTSENIKDNNRHDFEKDLLPLIKLEMKYAYYNVLFQQHQFDFNDISLTDKKLEQAIQTFHELHPEIAFFDIDTYLNPLEKTDIKSGNDFHSFTVSYLRKGNSEAEIGTEKSAFAAVSQVWSKVTPTFIDIFKFGGLRPHSHENFIKNYSGLLNRVTYGPPVENMQKMVALAEHGLLSFRIGPCSNIALNKEKASFEIESKINKEITRVDYLIDARIPKIDIDKANHGLYYNLLKRGEIKLFQNECKETNQMFKPGCMTIEPSGYIVDAHNNVNKAIAATGAPTEGVTYDNDALSPHRNNFVSKWARNIKNELKTTAH
ncbi:FAD/NAD(P)-binding protein [Fulvivirga sediminis]|uniref:FAD/NAD(P)-binding protein n=1 Tax=Fulvivirga sediminis TaxID=2803949 RepID=A0A937FBU5_9BACT|nr:FAD/NAD(P)-binding protein [Fulvivirga sediminis]MBL3658319.1 FAD/NAD(P)-binding protein [Fulvivirga sediminis]